MIIHISPASIYIS